MGVVSLWSLSWGRKGDLQILEVEKKKIWNRALDRFRRVSLVDFCKLSPLPQGVSALGTSIKEQK